MNYLVRDFLMAVRYFTALPLKGAQPGAAGLTPELLRMSARHFPAVGWLVGIASCVAFAVLGVLLPQVPLAPLAGAVGCTIAGLLLTGARHEEALARVCEASAGGAAPREPMRAGTLAMGFALAAKVALLALLADRAPLAVLTALFAAHAVSRFWPLVLMQTLTATRLPHAPPARKLEARSLAVAAAWCLPPLLLMPLARGPLFVLLALALSAAALWALRAWLRHRGQGFNADTLGAAQQVCEIAFYLGAAIGVGNR